MSEQAILTIGDKTYAAGLTWYPMVSESQAAATARDNARAHPQSPRMMATYEISAATVQIGLLPGAPVRPKTPSLVVSLLAADALGSVPSWTAAVQLGEECWWVGSVTHGSIDTIGDAVFETERDAADRFAELVGLDGGERLLYCPESWGYSGSAEADIEALLTGTDGHLVTAGPVLAVGALSRLFGTVLAGVKTQRDRLSEAEARRRAANPGALDRRKQLMMAGLVVVITAAAGGAWYMNHLDALEKAERERRRALANARANAIQATPDKVIEYRYPWRDAAPAHGVVDLCIDERKEWRTATPGWTIVSFLCAADGPGQARAQIALAKHWGRSQDILQTVRGRFGVADASFDSAGNVMSLARPVAGALPKRSVEGLWPAPDLMAWVVDRAAAMGLQAVFKGDFGVRVQRIYGDDKKTVVREIITPGSASLEISGSSLPAIHDLVTGVPGIVFDSLEHGVNGHTVARFTAYALKESP